MKTTETNCETGETIERDMTAEEEASHLLVTAQMVAEKDALAAEEAAIEAAIATKASAVAKLQAIGLTEEEALAIIG